MSDQRWKTLDAEHAQKRAQQQRESATTSGNAGGFAVPLGGVLRPAVPASEVVTRKKKRP
jgi:hypothetical protein